MKRAISILMMCVLVGGCATPKLLQATGGSKADGIVELSYDYTSMQKPVVDWNDGLLKAQDRCRAWGYVSADPFGGTTSMCQAYNQYGCVRWLVTVKYQCAGNI